MFGDHVAPDRSALSTRQRDALRAIETHIAEDGRSPTYRELANRLDVRSVTSAVKLVAQLERKGHVDVEEGTARGIRVVGSRGDAPANRLIFIPEAAAPRGAGWPDPREGYWVDRQMLPAEAEGKTLAYITMPDDSMARDGIQKHDIIVGWPESSGDIPGGNLIIHALNRQFTVRRLQRYGDRLILTAADPTTPRTDLKVRPGPTPGPGPEPSWPIVGRAGLVIRRRL